MNYVGRLLSNFKGFYNEINSATLTGAIDVVVVEQQDGSLVSSPFHVRFGKMGVLRAREKIVDIEVNDQPVDLQMKLGEAGEAFFVQETKKEGPIPAHLATSPIPSELELMEEGLKKLKEESKTASLSKQDCDLAPVPEFTEVVGASTNADRVVEEERCTPTALGDVALSKQMECKIETEDEVSMEASQASSTQDCSVAVTPADLEASDSSNSLIKPLAKDDSQSSIYFSLHNGLDTLASGVVPIENQGSDFPISNREGAWVSQTSHHKDSCDLAIQTDMTGAEVEKKRVQSPPPIDQMLASTSSPGGSPTAKKVRSRTSSGKRSRHSSETKIHIAKISDSSNSNLSGHHVRSISESLADHDCAEVVKKERSETLDTQSSTSSMKLEDELFATRARFNKRRKLRKRGELFYNYPRSSEGTEGSGISLCEEEIFSLDISDDEVDSGPRLRTVSMPVIMNTAKAGSGTEDWVSSHAASAFHPFSDGDISPDHSPMCSRPESPKSDTELDMKYDATSQTMLTGDDLADADNLEWHWGKIPEQKVEAKAEQAVKTDDPNKKSGGLFQFMRQTKKLRHQPEQKGIYLDDLNLNEMDPEVAALYLYNPKSTWSASNTMCPIKDEDSESGRGTSLPQSPTHEKDEHHNLVRPMVHKVGDSKLPDVAMSLCGGLKETEGQVPQEKFLEYLVTYDEFCDNPAILNNSNLVIRLEDKFYNWQMAAPMMMSMLAFHQPLSEPAMEQIKQKYMGKREKRRSWWSWGSAGQDNNTKPSEHSEKEVCQESEIISCKNEDQGLDSMKVLSLPGSPEKGKERHKSESHIYPQDEDEWEVKSDGGLPSQNTLTIDTTTDVFTKTIHLTSEQIDKLNLRDGPNKISFSVTTMYQGTSKCEAYIYKWKWDDKIVVSDIDGTITRSDVLGQILPIVGKDWSQAGIAQLYNMIHKNGYKFVYLSARAIGQSRITRDYLQSIKQGDLSLPEGPLLLSPSSLISAFHKEVIERKPEEFKIGCLRNISALFPVPRNPFYAGYGNKINDTWAYKAVGIPVQRIFTVNHRGELKWELSNTFQSSYAGLQSMVDQMFPPLMLQSVEDITSGTIVDMKMATGKFPAADEFSNFTYWREPLPAVNIDLRGSPEKDNSNDVEDIVVLESVMENVSTETVSPSSDRVNQGSGSIVES